MVLTLTLLAGCFHLSPSDAESRLHLLDQGRIVAWTAAEPVATALGPRVQRVDMPSYLEDLRVFYRRTDGSPAYVDTDRWAEPLREGIARYLNAAIVNTQTQALTANVRLRFDAFEPVRGSGVWLEVRVEQGDSVRLIRLREGTGQYASVADMVAEMADALDALLLRL